MDRFARHRSVRHLPPEGGRPVRRRRLSDERSTGPAGQVVGRLRSDRQHACSARPVSRRRSACARRPVRRHAGARLSCCVARPHRARHHLDDRVLGVVHRPGRTGERAAHRARVAARSRSETASCRFDPETAHRRPRALGALARPRPGAHRREHRAAVASSAASGSTPATATNTSSTSVRSHCDVRSLRAGLPEERLHFELFDGGHRGVSHRYPLSLAYLVGSLSITF